MDKEKEKEKEKGRDEKEGRRGGNEEDGGRGRGWGMGVGMSMCLGWGPEWREVEWSVGRGNEVRRRQGRGVEWSGREDAVRRGACG
jgi:hypothetical protein